MSCPRCSDPRYPDASDGRFLPLLTCAACGYKMDADERAVWNAAFGASSVTAVNSPKWSVGDALRDAARAVQAHQQARDHEARRAFQLPPGFEPVFEAFKLLRQSFAGGDRKPDTYIAYQGVLHALESVVDPPRRVRAGRAILGETPHDQLTLEFVEAIAYVVMGEPGFRLSQATL